MKKISSYLLLALCALILLACIPPLSAQSARIAYIYQTRDGDSYEAVWARQANDSTIVPGAFKDAFPVRLYGADTPEQRNPYVSKAQPYATEAAAQVRILMTGQFVRIETLDTLMDRKRPTILAKVELMDGRDLASVIAAYGWGWPFFPDWPTKPTADQREYRRLIESLNRVARGTKSGIWSLKGRQKMPSTWRKNHPGGDFSQP